MKSVWSRNQTEFFVLPRLVALGVVLVFSSSGCTLKSRDQRSMIKLKFSKAQTQAFSREVASSMQLKRNSLSSANSGATGLMFSYSDFTCFGIQVTAADITGDPRMGCTSSAGILGGLVPASGGEIDLDVPAGAARKVQVFGIRSAVGCPGWNEILNKAADIRYNGLDKPYELGSTTVDVFSDTSVTVHAKFDPTAMVEAFPGCSVGQADYGHPTNGTDLAMFSGGSGRGLPNTCRSNTGRPCLAAKYSLDSMKLPGGVAMPPASPTHVQKYNLQLELAGSGSE